MKNRISADISINTESHQIESLLENNYDKI